MSRWLVAISLVVASITGFASNQLLDEDSFAGLVSTSIERVEVRKLLATKAVDVALDASDADAALAAALPEEYSLIATPALELSKPAIAEAAAQLLGIDAVTSGLETAARSVHRQTASVIVSETEADVLINTLPVLVVVAEEIAGDVGARAAVGVDLPASATSINLGSNTSLVWSIVRSLSYVAAIAAVLWVISLIMYFVTAGRGRRLAAARRLGRTIVKSGIAIVVAGWLLLIVAAGALEVALSSDEAISVGRISLGGLSDGGGAALAEVVFDPLIGAGRRSIYIGLGLIAITYVLGKGAVATACRGLLRRRDFTPLVDAVEGELSRQVRHAQRALTIGLAVALLMWPRVTLRVALTLTCLAVAALGAIAVMTGVRAPAGALRQFFALDAVDVDDTTERSDRAVAERRVLFVIAVVAMVVWPSYGRSGLMALVISLSAVFAMTYQWELRPADNAADELALTAIAETGWSWRRKLVVMGLAAAGVASMLFGGDTVSPASASAFSLNEPVACNGHAELCDRALNNVALAGTHNSMSASALGWELANHEGAIPAQLDAGIRALLIDVQYWPQGASVEQLELDPRAAEIAADAMSVDAPPEDGLWMCHQLCQLGGTPFSDFLADLRAFLETHPDEVVVIVIQDEAPAADITAAIELAGVDQHAYAHEPDTPWATLGELIAAGTRVVFMAENEVDGSSWYQLAFDGNVSETGFRYSVVEAFDCVESRGGNQGHFFMINHWVETGLPIPAEADEVNSVDVLRRRVEQCVADRGREPGIIAINFWERGDLLSYVDELNGVGG